MKILFMIVSIRKKRGKSWNYFSSKKGFITKGDANETQDIGVVRWDQIKGKQLFGLPYIGFLFLRTEKQMAVSLLIGSLILFSLFVIQNQFKRRI